MKHVSLGVLASCAMFALLFGCNAEPSDGENLDDQTPDASQPMADASIEDSGPARVHPLDYALPEMHGPDTKLHVSDCRECHAADLTGGETGFSCDACHTQGWRTTCTFCHGGVLDTTGAPPRDIHGTTDQTMITFRAHPQHVAVGIHAAFDCTQCHAKPTDVLTPGHIFDDQTDGVSEVDFSGGLSPHGVYNGNGSCSMLYCHGNGRGDNGSYSHDMPAPTCSSCHPDASSSTTLQSGMSGQHRRHIFERIVCSTCHAATVRGDQILDPNLHVNGVKDVVFAANTGITFSGGRCSGNCHGEVHNSRRW